MSLALLDRVCSASRSCSCPRGFQGRVTPRSTLSMPPRGILEVCAYRCGGLPVALWRSGPQCGSGAVTLVAGVPARGVFARRHPAPRGAFTTARTTVSLSTVGAPQAGEPIFFLFAPTPATLHCGVWKTPPTRQCGYGLGNAARWCWCCFLRSASGASCRFRRSVACCGCGGCLCHAVW